MNYPMPTINPPQGYYGSAQPHGMNLPQQAFQGGFQPGPGFGFRMQQAQRGLDARGAARGSLMSGAHLKRTQRLSQGMMSNEWDNYMRRLAALSQAGQGAINTVAGAGQQAGQGMASAYNSAGQARAMGAVGSGNAMAGMANSLGGAFGGMNWNQFNPMYGQGPTPYDTGYGTPF
jgi:hypothetical protein